MRKITKLLPEAIQFINRKFIEETGKLLTGKQTYKLPYSNIPQGTIFTANVRDKNGNIITTEDKYKKLIIEAYNEFGELYKIDPNILLAQAYRESNFRTYAYSPTGALGFTQFIPATVFDTFVANNQIIRYNDSRDLSIQEKALITTGLVGNIRTKSTFFYDNKFKTNTDYITNRGTLHQNLMDNPRTMIKAQFLLMDYIGSRNENIATASLFAYNRGSGLKSLGYSDIVSKYISSKRPNLEEGTTYVNKIFDILVRNFNYSKFTELTNL
jgi:hypothetical protein